MNSLEQAEDLKAFERRLTEYIHCLQPATGRWRMLLIVVSVCTATGAWNWLIDPETQKLSFHSSRSECGKPPSRAWTEENSSSLCCKKSQMF
uniref:Nuclear envelope phosphatase-regulatory subunit 1 n=1 Tax=Myotis myotis TaxID=51298 RepID=A0A7J7SAM3_MYOMY|nr:CTD nuclear envelope phosphatase 1 regulatory subunit 1 [Myotis myotis]